MNFETPSNLLIIPHTGSPTLQSRNNRTCVARPSMISPHRACCWPRGIFMPPSSLPLFSRLASWLLWGKKKEKKNTLTISNRVYLWFFPCVFVCSFVLYFSLPIKWGQKRPWLIQLSDLLLQHRIACEISHTPKAYSQLLQILVDYVSLVMRVMLEISIQWISQILNQ